jgi:hypothetical protein
MNILLITMLLVAYIVSTIGQIILTGVAIYLISSIQEMDREAKFALWVGFKKAWRENPLVRWLAYVVGGSILMTLLIIIVLFFCI